MTANNGPWKKSLTDDDKAKALKLWHEGLDIGAIAERMRRGRGDLSRHIRETLGLSDLRRRVGGGAWPK